MKLNSQSIAQLVILLSLGIATTSGIYANNTAKSVAGAKSSLMKLQQDSKNLQQASAELLQQLKTTAEPPQLTEVVSALLLDIMRQRLESGITVATVTPSENIATNSASPISALAKPLDSSEVSSARINIRGSYDSYEGLLNYIEQLRKKTVAVVYLKVEGQQFELGLRAYGV